MQNFLKNWFCYTNITLYLDLLYNIFFDVTIQQFFDSFLLFWIFIVLFNWAIFCFSLEKIDIKWIVKLISMPIVCYVMSVLFLKNFCDGNSLNFVCVSCVPLSINEFLNRHKYSCIFHTADYSKSKYEADASSHHNFSAINLRIKFTYFKTV